MDNQVEFLLLMFIKHFICDFPLQMSPWMYKNKGTYGHMGGLTHASIHALFTLIIGICFIGGWGIFMALLDYGLHYHIDWAKMNINKYFDLRPDNSEWFWVLLGFDQFLHTMTYFLLSIFI